MLRRGPGRKAALLPGPFLIGFPKASTSSWRYVLRGGLRGTSGGFLPAACPSHFFALWIWIVSRVFSSNGFFAARRISASVNLRGRRF